jgi:hypothetical protein
MCFGRYMDCGEYKSWLDSLKQIPVEEFVDGIGTVRVFIDHEKLNEFRA